MDRFKTPSSFPRGLAGKLKTDPKHIYKIRWGLTRPSISLALAIHDAVLAAGITDTPFSKILQPDENFLEACRRLLAENKCP